MQRLALVSTALYGRLSLAELEEADRQARAGSFDANWKPPPRALDATAGNFGMTPQINDELNQSRAVAGQWVRTSERGVLTGRIEELLPRVKAPTLLVYGTSGTYLKYQEIARERLSGPRIVTINAKGAFVHQEAPGDTAPRPCLAFLLEKGKF